MDYFNTIVLVYASETFTNIEYKRDVINRKDFVKGQIIFEKNNYPTELKRWNISEKEEALKELAKYKCSYPDYYECYYNDKYRYNLYTVEEYALAYCDCDDDGEFLYNGYDYDLAEDETEVRAKEIAQLLQEGDNRNPQLLKELCALAALKDDWEEACDYELDLASGDAEEGDGETCEEVALYAAERLGVKI